MLNPDTWIHLTEGLDVGRRRRVNHVCGEGRTLLITRESNGYSVFCFRCSESGFAPGPQESLTEKLARIAALRAADAELNPLDSVPGSKDASGQPEPATYDVDSWPASATLWFYKAGLSRADIGKLRAYYHEPTGRVVLPVEQNGFEYWQARALDGRQPKYLAKQYRPPSLIARWGSAPSPTLSEDILSAYKVGLVGEGWAVMGTRIPSAYVAELLRRRSRVNIWLDPDAAGQRAARKYAIQLRAYNLEVNNIVSRVDPKKHTLDEIKEYIA